MRSEEINQIVTKQRAYFYEGKTLNVEMRIQMLKRFQNCIQKYEKEIEAALKVDLGKSSMESYMCEVGLTLSELTYMIRKTKTFAREKTVWTPMAQFCARSFEKPSPYGVVLIMSPWNYPFLLTMEPLVDALAAGNTVVLKPSAYSPNTSAVIEKIITECFDPRYVAVVTGGREENTYLLEERFDYIFFTGSQEVGKVVMQKAAKNLTPVTLELGGKSPCIVEKTANLKLAAKRIVFGKYMNCGQTCVAPDYIYCDKTIKDELIKEMKREIRRQYGRQPLKSNCYGKMINKKHFKRVSGLMENSKIVHGGKKEEHSLQIEPTILDDVHFGDKVMQEEIFGPLLPVLTYDSIDGAIQKINSMEHPLALYIFSSDQKVIKKVTKRCIFGGGCINDTIIHLAISELGFGGIGASGMGSYHGKHGFDTFSHKKSLVDKKTWIDLPMRYQPYRKIYEKLVHFFLK